MKRYTADILSEVTGLSVLGATLSVVLPGTETRVVLYQTDDVTGPNQVQPVPNGVAFYAPDGRYDLIATKTGRTARIPGVDLFDGLEQNRRLEAVENGEPGALGSLRADLAASVGGKKVGFRQDGTGAVDTTVYASVREAAILPNHFDLTFVGASVGTKVQQMVDAGDQHGRPVILPPGLGFISQPLDLRGRKVDLRGQGQNATVILPLTPMTRMVNIAEAVDQGVSPLSLTGMRLDCDGKAEVGIDLRYRHKTRLEDLYVLRATNTGIREKDAWNNARSAITIANCPIGWHLQGSNHNSVFSDCSITASDDVHLKIGSSGTVNDGNLALRFASVDIEYGAGRGVEIAAGAVVTFDTCYIGEGINGEVFQNAGHTRVVGGLVNWGHSAAALLCRPRGGRMMFSAGLVGGQAFGGLQQLIGVSPADLDAGIIGKVSFRDVVAGYPVSAPPVWLGDVLDVVPGRNFVPSYGQDFVGYAFDGAVHTDVIGSSARMTVDAPGTSGVVVMRVPIAAGMKRGDLMSTSLVFEATKGISVRLVSAPFGAAYAPATASASSRKATVSAPSFLAPPAAYSFYEIQLVSPVAGDTLTIHRASLGDANFVNPSTGFWGNLGLAA